MKSTKYNILIYITCIQAQAHTLLLVFTHKYVCVSLIVLEAEEEEAFIRLHVLCFIVCALVVCRLLPILYDERAHIVWVAKNIVHIGVGRYIMCVATCFYH